MDRSITYDFLLTFHSNHGLSRTVSEINGNFSQKLQIFPTPVYLTPTEGFFWELSNNRRPQETRIMGLPGQERSLTISLAIWIQYTNVTDGQTDTGWEKRPCSCIVSHSRKISYRKIKTNHSRCCCRQLPDHHHHHRPRRHPSIPVNLIPSWLKLIKSPFTSYMASCDGILWGLTTSDLLVQ